MLVRERGGTWDAPNQLQNEKVDTALDCDKWMQGIKIGLGVRNNDAMVMVDVTWMCHLLN